MKKVVFYFNDGSYKYFFGYGSTDRACISDAENFLTDAEIKELQSTSVYDPMPSEY